MEKCAGNNDRRFGDLLKRVPFVTVAFGDRRMDVKIDPFEIRIQCRYFPVKWGSRFSTNARAPSL